MLFFCAHISPATPVPTLLSSLLHRMRKGVLALLLVVLPLQGVVQLVAGLQGHRHVHSGAAPVVSPLRALLDHLHAVQDPRLKRPAPWVLSQGPAAGLHEHGGVFHRHASGDADVLDVVDPGDGSLQGGATAFLAWLPAALALPKGERGAQPATGDADWRDRVVAPPLTPPRG